MEIRVRDEKPGQEDQTIFERLFEFSPDAIVVVDSDGRIRRINAQVEAMFGYARAELLGAQIDLLLPERFRDRHVVQRSRFQADPHVRPMGEVPTLLGRRKDGTEFPVDITLSPVHTKEGSFVLGVVRDVTESRRAEQALSERNLQLEAANRELESFSYSVSHDLRAPLRAIDGFSSIVLRDHAAALPAEGRRHLGLVREGAQQMARLIDDLLAFAKTARQPIAKRTVSLKELVTRCLEEFRAEISERKAEVAVGNLPDCQADPALLKQALVNLLGNAVKYTRKRAGAKIEVGYRSENGEQAIYVKDNGVGFDMKYAGKLFGVFQRLHHKDEFEGTGVGLAIVQRVVHRHGGRVWAEAESGKGATFYFTLGKDTT
jgi:PAS domain S-box-containing protein